jgi:hypothetical protein
MILKQIVAELIVRHTPTVSKGSSQVVVRTGLKAGRRVNQVETLEWSTTVKPDPHGEAAAP